MLDRRVMMGAVLGVLPGVIGVASPSSTSVAQESWPQRPVTVVVPYGPGGTSDILARLTADKLSQAFRQTFVVENQGGAAGSLGSQRIARSAPDGYSLLVADVGSHVVAPMMFGASGVNTLRDFSHIAMLGGSPFVMVVHPSLPIHDLKGLIEYVKSQPKGLNWNSPGIGSRGHLLGEMFKTVNGLNMVHISYKGAGPAVIDVLANHLPMGFVTLSAVGDLLKTGKLRGIGVTSEVRLPSYPDVPTVGEQGYPKMTTLAAFMLVGPAKMPVDVINRLNSEVRKSIDSSDMQQKFASSDLMSQNMSPTELREFLRSEQALYGPIVASLNLNK